MPAPTSRIIRTPAEPQGGPIPPGMRDAGPPHNGPLCLGPTGDWLCRQRADNGHSDRPGGDVGLAIALAGILDTEQPEPPAATALVRVLRECDRIERAVRANPKDPDFDGAYLACLGQIRKAAGLIPPDPMDSSTGKEANPA